MSKQRFIWLLITMSMVYTQGLWERIFFLQPGTTIIVELPLWIYLLQSLKTFTKPAPGRSLVIIYLILSFLFSFVNQSGFIAWAKYIRFFIYFYLIYLSLWNTPISPKQWHSLFKTVIIIIVLQGIGSAFNMFVLNQRVEGHVGLMSSLGGTTASTFPLLVISMSSLIYLFSRRQGKKFNGLLLLLTIASIFVGYESGKRAIFFTIPLFFIISIIISYSKLKDNRIFYKKLLILGTLLIVSVPLYIYGISTSRGLNYGLNGNETKQQIIEKALNYAQNYEAATASNGNTIGRTGTTLQIVNNSINNPIPFLFGYGFGSVKSEKTQSILGINYGIVGFTRDIVSAGWILMLLTLGILIKVIASNHSIPFTFTHLTRILLLLIFIFTHFFYSSDFTVSLKINFLLIIASVFINSPLQAGSLYAVITRYFVPTLKK